MEDRNTISFPEDYIMRLKEMVDIDGVCVVHGAAGKTSFIRSIYPAVIVYDSREILEPKNLGGMYVIKDGEVSYVRGILIEAMVSGSYLCFKKIDLNISLLQYLRPVLNERKIIGNNGALVSAHKDFRLFFTASSPFPLRNVTFIGPIRFSYDAVIDSFDDMKTPIERVLKFVAENQAQKCPGDRGVRCEEICFKNTPSCSCETGDFMCSDHFYMLCDLRAFLLSLRENGPIDSTNHNRCVLYQAVVNIILKHDSPRLSEFLLTVHPSLSLPNMLFAKTEPVELTLRGLISNIRYRKPTLLVGETGAGKTALIQYLCDNSMYFFNTAASLKIVNISSDFDSASLIGGYQSVDFDLKIKELYHKVGAEMPVNTSRKAHLNDIILKCRLNASDVKTNGRLPPKTDSNVCLDVQSEAELHLKLLDQKLAFFYKEGILTQAMRNGTWLLLDEINLASEETLDLIEAVLSKTKLTLYESGSQESIKVHSNFMIFACMNPFGDYGKKQYDSRVFNKLIFYDFSRSLRCIRAVVHSVSRNMLEHVDGIAEFYFEFKKALCSKRYSNIIEPLVTGRTLCRVICLIQQLQTEKDRNPIYDAFNLLFFTQLDLGSRAQAITLFKKHFKALPCSASFTGRQHSGGEDTEVDNSFIVTPKVKIHMDDVELAIKAGLPVLFQGDTSTGKTSLIYALAKKHGVRVLRVNNHAHTDSSDYIGNYTSGAGGIVFQEGVLLTAMRKGCWIILDELNLAPSDVLEVLNRLLDDNREVYVPELDEVVRPHPSFRIFATQNINYSGRQGLAKSLRNRFVEVFFFEKDENELREIIEKRCRLPAGFSRLMMTVYSVLRAERTVNSLITLRDLFKWARRGPRSYYEVYEIGLDILMAKQRTSDDKKHIFGVFNLVFKDRIGADKKDYSGIYVRRYGLAMCLDGQDQRCEPAFPSPLGCNETPCGDMHGEHNDGYVFNNIAQSRFDGVTHDLIVTRSYLQLIDSIYKAWICYEPVLIVGETGIGKTKICEIVAELFGTQLKTINMHNGTESSDFIGRSVLLEGQVFWRDGILAEAMMNGDALLIDEINLAEDAVLERMNSVLEDRRSLFVTEVSKEYVAHDAFRVVATMNPGGDYGKREISPALRNRFTEIYFQLENDEYVEIFDKMVDRIDIEEGDREYYKSQFGIFNGELSIRKIELVTTHLRNVYEHRKSPSAGRQDDVESVNRPGKMQGVEIMIDDLNTREQVWNDVLELLGTRVGDEYVYKENADYFGVSPYYLCKPRDTRSAGAEFCFSSDTTRLNLQRIIRSLTLSKGILLEGEPGVGKTSIVQNIAAMLGIPFARINLSEQTEMSDLVGAYLPVGPSITFVESEMVEYIKKGHWIILDEINLCTQSMVEGLNSMLDHRGEIRVNDINVKVHNNTRIFGTMNPINHLNGRKQLPKSFLDRFIIIPMASYSSRDIQDILEARYKIGFVFDPTLSLRGNIKLNELEKINRAREPLDTGSLLPHDGSYSQVNVAYHIGPRFCIGNVSIDPQCLDESYVLVHSQLPQIEQLLKCFQARLPVILCGETGRSPMLRFVSKLIGLDVVTVDCHRETDTCDLLGQYQKAEHGDSLFEWRNSHFVDALSCDAIVVFNMPELVDKCVFDRLSSVFESDRFLSIYEKGIDIKTTVNDRCMFVLCCDDPYLLSPALLDRCVLIEIDSSLSYIDLYKIFHAGDLDRQKEDAGRHLSRPLKRFKNHPDNNRFREFLDADQAVDIADLDYLVRKFCAHGTVPSVLNRKLSVYNVLREEDIDELFRVGLQEERHYDKTLLDGYKHISSFASPLPSSYKDRINNLTKNSMINVFIKNLKYTDDASQDVVCYDAPSSMKDLKIRFIKNLKVQKLADFEDIRYFADHIADIKDVVGLPTCPAYFVYDEDPLLLVRCEVENEKIHRENEMLLEISDAVKRIYKYGNRHKSKDDLSPFDALKGLVQRYDLLVEKYTNMIIDIDKRLGRDYGKFKSVAEKITFCDYFRNKELREFLEEFSDVFDYRLVSLFVDRGSCGRCVHKKSMITTMDTSLRLLRMGEYTKCTKYEYCKYFYNLCTNKRQDVGPLVFEALCFDDPVDQSVEYRKIPNSPSFQPDGGDTAGVFLDSEIDACLRSIFPARTTAQVIETRKTAISLGRDFKSCELLGHCSIFSTPESLVEKVHDSKIENENKLSRLLKEDLNLNDTKSRDFCAAHGVSLDDALKFLTSCYKTDTSLLIDRNYRYFLYFFFNPVSPASLERFFLGCAVYEFVDRIHFAQEFLRYSYSDLLYNVILQYKAFEVEELYSKKNKECRLKLRKEPLLYQSTIHNYVDRFLYIPITSVIAIKFEQPACQNVHRCLGPAFLLGGLRTQDEKAGGCECSRWIQLSKKTGKAEIFNALGDRFSLTKDAIVHKFYNRVPGEQFGYGEICLSKTFSTVIENINKNCYETKDAASMLKLLDYAFEYPFPPFLYFIYKFSDVSDTKVEDGAALKNGQGENTIEEKVKEEDICDDYDNNPNENVDSEGIEMDNEGEMHSVSSENEGDSDVDDQNNSGEKEIEDYEERGAMDQQNDQVEADEEAGVEEPTRESEDAENAEITDGSEESSCFDEAARESESIDGEDVAENSDQIGNDRSDDPESVHDNLAAYEWEEAKLNREQTCQNTTSYNRKVEGGNLEEKDALAEGEGEEFVEGEGLAGKGASFQKTVTFPDEVNDCMKLTNLLKVILASNRNSKYKGDYKSGRKLNLRKIIPYIASDFRKDRIWMKRQKKDKKSYIIRLFVDNSKSMFDQKMVDMLGNIYYKLFFAFSTLNVPVQLYKFGQSLQECKVSDLTFTDETTSVDWIDDFNDGINIILTDGVFQNVGSFKSNFLVLMIDRGNIRKMSKVSVIESKVFVEKYLDTFALNYCLIEDASDLEQVFVETLGEIIKSLN